MSTPKGNHKDQNTEDERQIGWIKEGKRLEKKLIDIFEQQSINLEELILDSGFIDAETATIQVLEPLLKEMLRLEKRIEEASGPSIDSSNWYRVMAKGFALTNDWVSAAKYYDKFIKYEPDNWQAHYLRGVAYQNCRLGKDTDLAALRAYNETIALAPDNIDGNVRARLYGYRGAALKRLKRLEEAENDLLLAQRWAREQYEIDDIAYNLSCIYAMMQQREKMLKYLRPLVKYFNWRRIIRNKKNYFGYYWNDPDFRHLILLGE